MNGNSLMMSGSHPLASNGKKNVGDATMFATSQQVRSLIDRGFNFSSCDLLIINVIDPTDLTVDQWLWLLRKYGGVAPRCGIFSNETLIRFCIRAARGDVDEAERLWYGIADRCE